MYDGTAQPRRDLPLRRRLSGRARAEVALPRVSSGRVRI